MRRAIAVVKTGNWVGQRAGSTITLPFSERHRRRVKLTDDSGAEFLLDLPETAVMDDGDALRLDDGGLIAVRAAEEDVCEVRCSTADGITRIAWHLGNRHLPVEIIPGGLRLRNDFVIEDMLRYLGATVTRTRAPFTPEGGAYARGMSHDHAHSHDHHHPHDHDHR